MKIFTKRLFYDTYVRHKIGRLQNATVPGLMRHGPISGCALSGRKAMLFQTSRGHFQIPGHNKDLHAPVEGIALVVRSIFYHGLELSEAHDREAIFGH